MVVFLYSFSHAFLLTGFLIHPHSITESDWRQQKIKSPSLRGAKPVLSAFTFPCVREGLEPSGRLSRCRVLLEGHGVRGLSCWRLRVGLNRLALRTSLFFRTVLSTNEAGRDGRGNHARCERHEQVELREHHRMALPDRQRLLSFADRGTLARLRAGRPALRGGARLQRQRARSYRIQL